MTENSLLLRLRHFFAHTLKIVFVAFTTAYGIVISLLLLIKWLIGESWGLIAFFNSILHLALLPALILLPLALLLRRWRTAFTVTLPALVFIGSYGMLFLPRPANVPSDGTHLHLLTFNLLSKTDGLESISDIIRESQADIVALQELSIPAADHFAAEFAERYPYRALHPSQPGVFGLGVFSRFPIQADEYRRIYLANQRVELEIGGQTVTLFNAHPIQPLVNADGFALRAQEIANLLEWSADEVNPVMLMGDFNMADQSEDYQRVTARYHDTYREVGWGLGPTFPAIRGTYLGIPVLTPIVRLDYVFHSAGFQPILARVWPTSGGSDHRPMLAELVLLHDKP